MKLHSNKKKLYLVFVLAAAVLLLSPWSLGAPPSARSSQAGIKPKDALLYQSSGMLLQFSPSALMVSDGSYLLRVDFVGAGQSVPVSEVPGTKDSVEPGPSELGIVRYNHLWAGIDLSYDRGGGILRSTYSLAAGVDPGLIRLRYNRPLALQEDGSLRIEFDNLVLYESAPLAWQMVDGQQKFVPVHFLLIDQQTIGFVVEGYSSSAALYIDPTLTWHTFLGSTLRDEGYAIAVDDIGNVYVTGFSAGTWGAPLRSFDSGFDAFVAKLNPDGSRAWNTFLGGSSTDIGLTIAVASDGSIIVGGYSAAGWGSPVNPYTASSDAFLAKLTSAGALVWNTFLGGSNIDEGYAVSIDASDNIFFIGRSYTSWGTPVRSHSGSADAFVARLNPDGTRVWHTFLGASGTDYGGDIAVDGNFIYVTGYSDASWGTPVHTYTGNFDIFVAMLSSAGALQWNTFQGSSDIDYGFAIELDGDSNIYVTGFSYASWGSPIRSFTAGNTDAYLAKFSPTGSLTWNTFLGGANGDYGYGVAIDGNRDLYVSGMSSATWGSPVRAYSGSLDAYAAKVTPDGSLVWNTFQGSSAIDESFAIAVDGHNNAYVTGRSQATWGSPVNAYAGDYDVFVARLGCIVSTGDGAWDTTTTWDVGRAPGSTDGACVLSGHTITLDAAGSANWLQIDPDGVLDLGANTLTVENSMTNNGTLQQTQDVGAASTVNFLRIRNLANTTDLYRGLDITTGVGVNLGTTVVQVKGSHTQCTNSGVGYYRDRCFMINPANAGTATVTLYTTPAEDDISDDAFFQYAAGSSWTEGDACNDAVGAGGACSGTATFASPAHFLIGSQSNQPTAVRLLSISTRPRQYLTWYMLVGLLVLILGGGFLWRRKTVAK